MAVLRKAAVLLTVSVCSVVMVAAPARAEHEDLPRTSAAVTTIAGGLGAPFQLSERRGRLYVMERWAGQVTEVDKATGETTPTITGLGTYGVALGATPIGRGRFAIVTGESGGASDPNSMTASSLYVAEMGGTLKKRADLLEYELKRNPDGQTQYGPDGTPLDSVSDPSYVIPDQARPGSVLVADAGGNDILRVTSRGRVSTFFTLPTINTGACKGRPNNDPQHMGCDGNPTGIAYGPGNTLYVSAMVSRVAGEGRIYVLNAKTGRVKRVIKGLSGPSGVAVDKRSGTVYVSELYEGLWASGPPPQGFQADQIGQIVSIPTHGMRRYAQVTMPSGLLFTDGNLYASTWSIAADFYKNGALGRVETVEPSAFVAAPS